MLTRDHMMRTMSTTALLLAMVAAAGVRGERFSGPNMNGDYLLAPTPNARNREQQIGGSGGSLEPPGSLS